MSLNGYSAPVSAFAMYKKVKNKSKDKVIPAKKQKLEQVDDIKINNKSANVKKISPSLPAKHNGNTILKKKPKKKVKKSKKQVQCEDKDDHPPLLVPIKENHLSIKTFKKVKDYVISLDKKEVTSVNTSFSDFNQTDSSPDGLKLFKWLLAPNTPKSFFELYWENKPLFIERNNEKYYSGILTTERLDTIFRDFPLYYTRNVDVVSYENGVKEVHNVEGRVSAAALYDYYSNGCSIRVLNPQTYDRKVRLLIATLQEYFGTMVGTNVYLTPPGSQGFAPHYDDIEAFILQLEGRKHWKLYKPKGADVLARDSSVNLKSEDLGEPFMEMTVNAGDLLYFPRGVIHEGRTDSDSHSLHITVSVYQHTAYADLLEHVLPDALKRAANENVEFRKGLPVNYLKYIGYVNNDTETKERNTITDNVKKLMKTLINYINVDQAADKLGRKFMYDSMPPVLSNDEMQNTSRLDGDYMKDGKVFNRVEIGMDTEIRLLRYHCLRLVVEEDIAKIYYNIDNARVYHGEEEQFVIINNELIPCIKKLQSSYPEFIAVEDLPIDDSIGKAQLVSDLWEKGLLVTNGPLPSLSGESDDENN